MELRRRSPVLPELAVCSDIEVLFDGGIRSGQDVFRALAPAARGCLVGRAYVYGLGAGGQAGMATAIEIIRRQLNVTMALMGVSSVGEIGGHQSQLNDRFGRYREPQAAPALIQSQRKQRSPSSMKLSIEPTAQRLGLIPAQ